MIILADEGFTDDESAATRSLFLAPAQRSDLPFLGVSVQEREELAYALLASLPRSRLANIQRRIAPLLQIDVVGLLPTELALQILSHLPWQSLVSCSMVSHTWLALADDPSLWKALCQAKGWEWNQSHFRTRDFDFDSNGQDDSDDEGMGDEEDDTYGTMRIDSPVLPQDDSGFVSMSMASGSVRENISPLADASISPREYDSLSGLNLNVPSPTRAPRRSKLRVRHSAPAVLTSRLNSTLSPSLNDYKRLYLTHIRLQNRVRRSSYRLSALQSRSNSILGVPANTPNGHSNTIYCLQLYTYPSTGKQVLFTGSKDRTIREWNLSKEDGRYGTVERVIEGVHESSVLSICAGGGYVASASSDMRVGVWELEGGEIRKVLMDHEDSVLCVRFDEKRLVSCSKDRTVRTYSFPDLTPQFVLGGHRAAVNAVSISKEHIVSASGDRSMRLWDAETGALLRTFENHHSRGMASIDFKYPIVLSGSSDKHLRLFDIITGQGWSTSPSLDNEPPPSTAFSSSFCSNAAFCDACGSARRSRREHPHGDLVRTVALDDEFVISGSYDLTTKVWSRKTGALVADLKNGHSGRIFCVGSDPTKIVSCGEDQRICIWDFSHGIDTSFIKL